jgi:ABC-type branched-subunit amino acid transport system ATPase component
MPLLQVEGVTSGYGDMEVLRDVSIALEPGEIGSIIGPNGAGKSTVMKVVFGQLRPWRGRVVFAGEDISHLAPYEIVTRGMCYVPQVGNVFTELTVEENLELGAFALDGRDVAARKERVFELFPRLKERTRQRAGKLSGGERQMLAMGSALMLDPQLLLLDEPSAGLAPKMVEVIFERIRRVNDTGVAILMVEQNARESLKMAHRGYVMANGQNRVDGPGPALADDPEVARLYLGG